VRGRKGINEEAVGGDKESTRNGDEDRGKGRIFGSDSREISTCFMQGARRRLELRAKVLEGTV